MNHQGSPGMSSTANTLTSGNPTSSAHIRLGSVSNRDSPGSTEYNTPDSESLPCDWWMPLSPTSHPARVECSLESRPFQAAWLQHSINPRWPPGHTSSIPKRHFAESQVPRPAPPRPNPAQSRFSGWPVYVEVQLPVLGRIKRSPAPAVATSQSLRYRSRQSGRAASRAPSGLIFAAARPKMISTWPIL